MSMKNKRGASIIKIYKPRLYIKLTLLCVTAIMLGFHFPVMLMVSRSTPEFPYIIFIFLLPLYTWLLWYTFITFTQKHMIIYDDGIEIQRGTSRFFSTWENMSHFRRSHYNKKQNFGIALSQKIQPEAHGLVEKLFYGNASDFLSLSDFIHVPWRWVGFFQSAVDTDKLAETDFGRDLLHYAPHLFEYGKEKQKNG